MNKVILLKIANPILFLLILFQVISGLLMRFADMDKLVDLHVLSGYGIALFIIIHLILNWSWVVNSYFKKKKA